MAKDTDSKISSQDLENRETSDDRETENNLSDIEYLASLLNELKQIADAGGHKLLFHLIEMACLEAEHLADTSQSKQESSNQPEVNKNN